MAAQKLCENLYSVGVMNPALRVFDIVMTARYGTTYNAYLIRGEKTVLVETVHEDFFDEYFETLCSVVDPASIDALVMNHTEPDHSGSIQKLLEKLPNLTIYASAGGKKFLDAQINRPCDIHVVKDGETLETGMGTLRFLIAPMLHWPDSMFTFCEQNGVLFSCDFLGAHYCEPRLFDDLSSHPAQYEEEFAYYYQGIFGPFKPHVLNGLSKIDALPLQMVCPSHGPVLRESFRRRMEQYRAWSAPAPAAAKKTVAVVYCSAYGYTAQLAKAAAAALEGDYDVRLLDAVTEEVSACAAALMDADAVLVGACTINRDVPGRMWQVLSSVDAYAMAGKPAGTFGSYGWTGEGPALLRDRLCGLKLRLIGEPKKVCFRPTDEDLSAMAAYAREVAGAIK